MRSSCFVAKTRKEEIVRLEKANSDADFTRMLKTRSLNPEHMERQTQLRREIRVRYNLSPAEVFILMSFSTGDA